MKLALSNHDRRNVRSPRGSVIVAVLWAIAVAAVIGGAVQLFAYRQASHGREAVQRVQARWAARGGMEQIIAIMAYYNERPVLHDAFAMTREMEAAWTGEFPGAIYTISHNKDGREWKGPMDEHAKLNINNVTARPYLGKLEEMTLDVLDAITDWTDEDDDISDMGVERDYYLSQPAPYEPRNGPLHSVAELELVAGVWPEYLRGEDWNFNNRLDPNENDDLRSLPDDEPDGILDPGWAGWLTVHSTLLTPTDSGLPRLLLRETPSEDLQERCGLAANQADLLISLASNPNFSLNDLIVAAEPSGGGNQPALDLSDEQLALVLAETTTTAATPRLPGKMNLNTVSEDLLREIFVDEDPVIVDELLYYRNNRAEGVLSLLELRDIPNIPEDKLRQLLGLFDVRSSVFTITSRGRSSASGLEVEIVAVVDRSTLPVTILEYREQ